MLPEHGEPHQTLRTDQEITAVFPVPVPGPLPQGGQRTGEGEIIPGSVLRRLLRQVFLGLLCLGWVPGAWCDEVAEPRFVTVSLRGRVEWCSGVLTRRFGVNEVPEAAERVLVLETPAGELHPLAEDIRGRAFRRDARLRHVDVELLARRYRGSPFVQVIQAFELRPDGKYELDYWCDICSITMFELKECDCCQGPIELRRRKVSE